MSKDKSEIINQNGPIGFVLFVAWVGALVYFVNHAHGFWEVVLAFLQACVWPAYVLYHVLETLAV
jgi:hypothetical protein